MFVIKSFTLNLFTLRYHNAHERGSKPRTMLPTIICYCHFYISWPYDVYTPRKKSQSLKRESWFWDLCRFCLNKFGLSVSIPQEGVMVLGSTAGTATARTTTVSQSLKRESWFWDDSISRSYSLNRNVSIPQEGVMVLGPTRSFDGWLVIACLNPSRGCHSFGTKES